MIRYTLFSPKTVHLIFRKWTLFTFIILFFVVSIGYARDVTLGWDSNVESDREGYRIYYDTASGAPYEGVGAAEGDSPIDVKVAEVETGDSARFTLTGLDDDTDYYFVLTAYNTRGQVSGYSVEVTTAEGVNAATDDDGGGGGGCFLSTTISNK